MKRHPQVLLSVILLWVVSCSRIPVEYESGHSFPVTPPPSPLFEWERTRFSGGDGTSYGESVIISAISESIGVLAEKDWLRTHYSGCKQHRQIFSEKNERFFDIIEITTRLGESKKIYFDITEFYGKHKSGEWCFYEDDGQKYSGIIRDSNTRIEEMKPWASSVGSMSGELVYQVVNARNNGTLGVGRLQNGKQEGVWKSWVEGLGEFHITYRSGKKNGPDIYWDTNGLKRYEAHFKDGIFHGTVTRWSEDGGNAEEWYWMGEAHGTNRMWYPNGSIRAESVWRRGKPASAPKEWDSKGELTAKCRKETPVIDYLCSVDIRFNRINVRDDGSCFLNVSETDIHDLAPLTNLPITDLVLSCTPVTDLSHLRSMKLVSLDLHGTKVSDITPLVGLPLRRLTLAETQVTDIRSVSNMPLEFFTFDVQSVTNGVDALRNVRTLESINLLPAAEFWQRYDARPQE